jgi:hypothetical protein
MTYLLVTGIDKDAGIADMSEFEIEIRRRLWVLLYVWDWYVEPLGLPNSRNTFVD